MSLTTRRSREATFVLAVALISKKARRGLPRDDHVRQANRSSWERNGNAYMLFFGGSGSTVLFALEDLVIAL